MTFRKRAPRGPRILGAIAILSLFMVAGRAFADWRASTITGVVLNEYTQAPVAGALLEWENSETRTDRKGEFTLSGVDKTLTDRPLRISGDDYAPQALPPNQDRVVVHLRPDVVAGKVVDDGGSPLAGVLVTAGGGITTQTGQDGQFRLKGVPRDPAVRVVAPGYRVVTLPQGTDHWADVQLQKMVVRGLYITFGANTLPSFRNQLVDKAKAAGLNAIMLDIKNDHGQVPAEIGAQESVLIGASTELPESLKSTIDKLKDMGLYVIARLVVFKDNLYAGGYPELAVQTRRGPYIDCEGQRWLDPLNEQSWEYNLELAENAARLGFDEIHFDYIRFPSDCIFEQLVYNREATPENQQQAIEGFLERASARVHALGAVTSAAVFGLTTTEEDIGIGQNITRIGRHVDYISPMVYPSTWRDGAFNSPYPAAEPYRIVLLSVRRAVQRLKDLPVQVRPWLQAFHDYNRQGIPYNWPEIEQQIKANQDAGGIGWLLWNPAGRYALDGPLP